MRVERLAEGVEVHVGDALACLRAMPSASVHCCVTSPPYWGLRDYGVAGQLGLEPTPEAYVAAMVGVFAEVRRVLRDDGTLWLNIGDSYARMQEGNVPQTKNAVVQPPVMSGRIKNAGMKAKDLVGIPWLLAFALRSDGWWLRQDIIWHKPNPMPESVTDRCTKAHEYIFLLSKSERYYFDAKAIAEKATYAGKVVTLGEKSLSKGQANGANVTASGNGIASSVTVTDVRNKRSVWSVTTKPYSEAHFATFPPKLIEPCILAGCPEDGVVLDPFGGAATTGLVAYRLNRRAVLCELSESYVEIQKRRLAKESEKNGLFEQSA